MRVGFRLVSALGASNTGTVTYNLAFDASTPAEEIGALVRDFVQTRQNLIASTIKVPGLIDRRQNLLVAAGANVIEGNGSHVKFEKDGIIASFHRPHPDKEAKRYQVRDAREFLMQIGVTP